MKKIRENHGRKSLTCAALRLLPALLALGASGTGCAKTLDSIGSLLLGYPEDDGARSVLSTYHTDAVKSLDPATAYDGISLDVVPSIFESLYQLDYLSSNHRIIPLLAADFPKISSDGLTLTIPIRRGIRFADDPCFKETGSKGREVTAQDFAYSMKRLAVPALGSDGFWLFQSRIAGLAEFREKLKALSKKKTLTALREDVLEGFQARDSHTLVIRLKRPDSRLLSLLTLSFISAVPHEALSSYGEDDGRWLDHPVGSGPFMLSRIEKDRLMVLDRNPDYHPDFYPTEADPEYRVPEMLIDSGKPLPFLDRIRIEVLPESEFAWQRFLKGRLDRALLSTQLAPEVLLPSGKLRNTYASKGYRISSGLSSRFFYIDINLKDPLLGGNKALRQALSHAIRREDLIEVWVGGRATKMDHALPPGLPDRPIKTALAHDHDLEKAKALLALAGYPGGQGLPALTLDLRGADSGSIKAGETLSKQLGAVGIKLNVQSNTLPAFLEKTAQRKTQLALSAWGLDYPDGENVFQLLAAKEGDPLWEKPLTPEYEKLYQEFARMPSGQKRMEVAASLDAIIQEETPWIYLFVQGADEITQPWLGNLRTSELITNRYKYLRVNQELKKKSQSVLEQSEH